VNASRHYDLMSRKELQELLAAMKITLRDVESSDSGMIALGTRLNVAYLVQSKLGQDARGHRLDLALFDIAAKRRIRDWPSNSKRDFQEILHHENRFFTTLLGPSKDGSENTTPMGGAPSSHWNRGLWSVGGISAAIGFAAYALVLRHDANAAHNRAESAYSTQSAQGFKTKAQEKDRQSLLFGGLAVLSLGASIVVWTF
jgi:hypothetical protein